MLRYAPSDGHHKNIGCLDCFSQLHFRRSLLLAAPATDARVAVQRCGVLASRQTRKDPE